MKYNTTSAITTIKCRLKKDKVILMDHLVKIKWGSNDDYVLE